MADEVDTLVPLALRVIGPAEDDCTSHLLRARNRTGPRPEIQRHTQTPHVNDIVSLSNEGSDTSSNSSSDYTDRERVVFVELSPYAKGPDIVS